MLITSEHTGFWNRCRISLTWRVLEISHPLDKREYNCPSGLAEVEPPSRGSRCIDMCLNFGLLGRRKPFFHSGFLTRGFLTPAELGYNRNNAQRKNIPIFPFPLCPQTFFLITTLPRKMNWIPGCPNTFPSPVSSLRPDGITSYSTWRSRAVLSA